jgi:SnoaL-like domain
VEWRTGEVLPDVDPAYHGHEGIRRFFSDFMAPWEWISVEPDRVAAGDDQVVIEAHFRARGRQGIEVDLVVGQLYVIRDELVLRFEGHPSFDEALTAAGLSAAQAVPWPAPRID